jgi:hypothetical protein
LTDGSGNALSGGSGFARQLRVLWGDYNDDGLVNAADLAALNNAIRGPYDVFADLDGDGLLTQNDLQVLRSRLGTSLP